MKIFREYMKCLILLFGGGIGKLLGKRYSVMPSMLGGGDENGPGRFIRNLTVGMSPEKYKIERMPLVGAGIILVISSMPIFMYKAFKFLGVKIVLRVDGFSYPALYDNHSYVSDKINRQKRMLTLSRIRTNYHIQAGISLADWVIYQSEFSKNMSARWLFNRDFSSSVVPNGVDTKLFRPIEKGMGFPKYISVHGNLRDTDIIRCALSVFARLIEEKIDSQIRFRLLGHMTDEVKQEVSSCLNDFPELSSKLEIFGPVCINRLSRELPKSSVSLHLTSGDWCPNSVLESLACGVPVVCQAYGGQSELVGSAGIIIDSKREYDYGSQVVQLATDAISQILQDQNRFSLLARDRAEREFSIEVMAMRYAEAFNEIYGE